MSSLLHPSRSQAFVPSVLLALLMQALSTSARAEVRVTGEPDAVTIEANEASVEELLIELSNAYGLQYRSSADLSRSVSGTFAGSLRQAVSRVLLLQGYNFGVDTSASGIVVAVYGKGAMQGSNVDLTPKPAPETRGHPPNLFRHGLPKRAQAQRHGKPVPVARMNQPHSTGRHRLQMLD